MNKNKILIIFLTLLSFNQKAIDLQKIANYGLSTGVIVTIPNSIIYAFKHAYRQSVIDPRIPADKLVWAKFLHLSAEAIDKLDSNIKIFRNLSILGLGIVGSSLILKTYYRDGKKNSSQTDLN